MKTQHFFVPVLDVGELLPFGIKKMKDLESDFKEQERARTELMRFVEILEKNLKYGVFYMGMDVIGEKSYERFLLAKGGFLEIMAEAPVAINAHFIDQKSAKTFLSALQKALAQVLAKNPVSTMLIESLGVQTQDDASLTVASWNKMKAVRKGKNKN